MKLSTRNCWKGTVTAITLGEVVSEVTLEIAAGVVVTSIISRAAVENLGLKVGDSAYALMKSTEITLATE